MMPTAPAPSRRPPGALAATLAMLLLAVLLRPAPGQAQNFVPDQGFYRVFQNDRFLGNERITFEQRSDSAVVYSVVNQQLPHPDGRLDTLRKTSTLIRSIVDGTLRDYSSYEILNGDVLTRLLSMSDTTYTSYRQSPEGGFGDTFARPPGRIYIVDPQVFGLFDVLGRDMHAQKFDERPVTLLYVTARDTAVDARVKRLGTGALRLGKKTWTAEKFSVTDPWSTILIWTAPDGRMLRLMIPAVGLRVDRDPDSLEPHVMDRIKLPPTGVPAVVAPDRGATRRAPATADSLPPPGR